MSVHMSKTREQYPLSTKKIIKKTFVGSIAWCFIGLMFYVFIFALLFAAPSAGGLMGLSTILFIVFILGIISINYLYQKWYFDVYFYDLTPDYIVIKKGPITPREITIPYERIQDVYVDQDLLDRILGIFDVHLSSATISSGMEAHIDGVEKPAADGLRGQLLQIVSSRISKNKAQPVPKPETPNTTAQKHE